MTGDLIDMLSGLIKNYDSHCIYSCVEAALQCHATPDTILCAYKEKEVCEKVQNGK